MKLSKSQGHEPSITLGLNRETSGIKEKNHGLIRSLTLINFMCHSHLEVDLNEKIVLVNGKNGSGKSAILTGLVLAFGGKASSTHRANSLKTLIKQDETYALITVKLNNDEKEGYEYNTYGNIIVLERKIGLDGTSIFKTRNKALKTISTRKEEISKIGDFFNIQTENPIIIMDQEMSRTFLNASSSQEKYKMFMEGTQLSRLLKEQYLINRGIEETKNLTSTKKEGLENLKIDYEKTQNKYKSMDKAKQISLRMDELKAVLAWKQIEDIEIDKSKFEKELESNIKLFENQDEETRKLEKNSIEIKSQLDLNLNETKKIQTQINEVVQTKSKQLREIQAKELEALELKNLKASLNRDMKTFKDELVMHEKRIKDEHNKQSADPTQKNKHQIETEIKKLEKQTEDFNEHINTNEQKANHLHLEISKSMSTIEDLKNIISSKEADKQRALRDIQNINTHRKDKLHAYGLNANVLSDIEKEHRFRQKPIGPFGLYVKLKDKRWADTIESIFSNNLNGFWTCCYEDQRLLRIIFEKHRCDCNIFVSRNENFDFSNGEPHPSFMTLLRILEIANPIVLRQLITINKIEKIILIADRKEADKVMVNPPQKVIACYSIDGYQVGHKGGGYATMAVSQYRGPPRLTNNIESKIKQLNDHVKILGTEIMQKKSELEKTSKQKKEMQKEYEEIQLNLNQIRTEVDKNKSTINKLKNDKDKLSESIDTEYLEDLKKNVASKIALHKSQFVEVRNKEAEKLKLIDILKNSIVKMDEEIKQCDKTLKKINAIKDELLQQLDENNKLIENKNSNNNKYQDNISSLRKQVDKQTQHLKESIELVKRAFPERKTSERTTEQLDREIKHSEEQLRIAEKNIGSSIEELAKQLSQKKKALKQAKRDIVIMENTINALKKSLDIRKNKWEQFRDIITQRAKKNFMANIIQRGHKGQLKINHIKKELETIIYTEKRAKFIKEPLISDVNNEQNSIENKNKRKLLNPDPRSLSGGEKSFSTVCLLLALWESVSSPIRCLDEYDVCMDVAHKNISTQLIVDFANKTSDVQYILITPQNESHDSVLKKVKRIKLDDPRKT